MLLIFWWTSENYTFESVILQSVGVDAHGQYIVTYRPRLKKVYKVIESSVCVSGDDVSKRGNFYTHLQMSARWFLQSTLRDLRKKQEEDQLFKVLNEKTLRNVDIHYNITGPV